MAHGAGFILARRGKDAFVITARHVLYPDECQGKQRMATIESAGLAPYRNRLFEPDIYYAGPPADDYLILRLPIASESVKPVNIGIFEDHMQGFNEGLLLGYTNADEGLPPPEMRSGSLAESKQSALLVTNAALLPGMSGGPVVLGTSGLVVGIVRGRGLGTLGRAADEGQITPLTALPSDVRQHLGLVFHYPVLRELSLYHHLGHIEPPYIPRKEEAHIHAELDRFRSASEFPAPFVVLNGPAGVGKTTVALRVAWQRRDLYPGGIVFISVDQKSPDVLPALLRAVAGDQAERADDDASVEPAMKNCRKEARLKSKSMAVSALLECYLDRRPPMLIILDNLAMQQVPEEWRHALRRVSVLGTSRNIQLRPITSIEIKAPPASAAHRMLREMLQHAGMPKREIDDEAVAQICRYLGNHPLALSVIVGVIQIKQVSDAAQLAGVIKELDKDRLAALRKGAGDPTRRIEYLLRWSFELLPKQAQHLLLAMGRLEEEPIPLGFLQRLMPDENVDQAKDVLLRTNFFGPVPGHSDAYLVKHTLIHAWARQIGDREQTVLGRKIDDRLKAMLGDDENAQLMRHYGAALQNLIRGGRVSDAFRLAEKLDHRLESLGLWAERRHFWESVAAQLQEQKSTHMGSLAKAVHKLATVYLDLGQYEKAQKLFRQSEEYSQRSDSIAHAANLIGLGIAAKRKEDLIGAQKLFEEGLNHAVKSGDPYAIALAQNELGTAYKGLQRSDEAEDLFDRSFRSLAELDAKIERTDAMHLKYAGALGLVEMNQGNLARSEKQYERAEKKLLASMARFVEADDQVNLAHARQNFGQLLMRVGKDDKLAGQYLMEAVVKYRSLDAQGQDLGNCLYRLAILARRAGDCTTARKHLQESLPILTATAAPLLTEARNFQQSLSGKGCKR